MEEVLYNMYLKFNEEKIQEELESSDPEYSRAQKEIGEPNGSWDGAEDYIAEAEYDWCQRHHDEILKYFGCEALDKFV